MTDLLFYVPVTISPLLLHPTPHPHVSAHSWTRTLKQKIERRICRHEVSVVTVTLKPLFYWIAYFPWKIKAAYLGLGKQAKLCRLCAHLSYRCSGCHPHVWVRCERAQSLDLLSGGQDYTGSSWWYGEGLSAHTESPHFHRFVTLIIQMLSLKVFNMQ